MTLASHNMPSRQEGTVYPSGDKLALIDLDGTLIDESYRLSGDGIYDAIRDAQSRGWTLGLSSDSPYAALQIWRDRFGLNGPIIAENGGVVGVDDRKIYDRADSAAFIIAARHFIESADKAGLNVWVGNPVEALLNNDLPVQRTDRPLVLVNGLREVSFSFFVREVKSDTTTLAINPDMTESVLDMGRKHYPPFDNLVEDLNHDYGLLITRRKHIDKRLGSMVLMRELGVSTIAMVGNSINDYVGSDIASHFAVGNAGDDFKSQADYVSAYSTATGVCDILAQLA